MGSGPGEVVIRGATTDWEVGSDPPAERTADGGRRTADGGRRTIIVLGLALVGAVAVLGAFMAAAQLYVDH